MQQLALIFTFGILLAFQNNAQNSRIYGSTKNYYTNFIIPNASLYLIDNGRIVQKTTSDDSGSFTFSEVEPGEYSISAYEDSTSYSAFEHVVIGSDSLFFVSVEMGKAATLKEIIIVEKRQPVREETIKNDKERRYGCEITENVIP